VTGGGIAGSRRVDLFDPVANSWQRLTDLQSVRWTHTATGLPNGKVLIAAGNDGSGANNNAELYDPAANAGNGSTALIPGSLTVGGWMNSAVALLNGDVFIAGGHNFTSVCPTSTANAQLYSYSLGTLSSLSPMALPRTDFTATFLPSTGRS